MKKAMTIVRSFRVALVLFGAIGAIATANGCAAPPPDDAAATGSTDPKLSTAKSSDLHAKALATFEGSGGTSTGENACLATQEVSNTSTGTGNDAHAAMVAACDDARADAEAECEALAARTWLCALDTAATDYEDREGGCQERKRDGNDWQCSCTATATCVFKYW